MLTLALDTATTWGRFALAEEGELLSYRPYNVTGSYADALLEQVDRLLAEGERERGRIAAVAVCRGPGSFTGVRIGVATAKALAHALGASLHAVTTLEAMAADVLAERLTAELAVPVLDARRGELFWGVYRRRDGWVEPVVPPRVQAPDPAWSALLEAVPRPDEAALCGDGVRLLVGEGAELRPELAGRGRPVLRQWSAAHPATARALAVAVSAGRLTEAEIHPFQLTPLYLRVSDAERHRGLDLTPAAPPKPGDRGGPRGAEDD